MVCRDEGRIETNEFRRRVFEMAAEKVEVVAVKSVPMPED